MVHYCLRNQKFESIEGELDGVVTSNLFKRLLASALASASRTRLRRLRSSDMDCPTS